MPHALQTPARKQSKWSAEEDALIIELRGSGMKWDDISKRLPGRSSISCRLHYQNYLERRSEWDEERKNRLARLYERFKPEMWQKVAEELQVPWRAAEAMHWQLGETEMARRAGVVPFSLNSTTTVPQAPQRFPPTRHAHSQSQGSVPREHSGLPSPRYTRGPPVPPMPPSAPPSTPTSGRTLSSRRESLPPRPSFGPPLYEQAEYGYRPSSASTPGIGLAPIQTSNPFGSGQGPSQGGRGGTLPSLAELTTGVSPYSTPAYSISGGVHSGTASPGGAPLGPLLPAFLPYPAPLEPAGSAAAKRRASPPDVGTREASRRRHHAYPRGGEVKVEEGGGGGGGGYSPPPSAGTGMILGQGRGQVVSPSKKGSRHPS
ncbi:snRNA-activating protein complex subunit 4 [Achaetomium macrosporum]|uniref:snRNA-activating protein complex subunit 4 n=1 Tax=Achaetomium macrosporum TaxID=79813 RepID=A0AAN7HDY7_9PEZI|nr:snRNA-activating protein complex subunit 4 [Achaetomium macrosporum]